MLFTQGWWKPFADIAYRHVAKKLLSNFLENIYIQNAWSWLRAKVRLRVFLCLWKSHWSCENFFALPPISPRRRWINLHFLLAFKMLCITLLVSPRRQRNSIWWAHDARASFVIKARYLLLAEKSNFIDSFTIRRILWESIWLNNSRMRIHKTWSFIKWDCLSS